MNIRLMKYLDATIGRVMVRSMIPPICETMPDDVHTLLIIRPGGIGDAVLLSPAIRKIRTSSPHTRITVLAEKRNACVFAMLPEVDRLFCYDCPGEFIAALRGSYDAVIDTEQWHRLSAIVTRLMSAPVKIGFSTNERQRMFTHVMPYSQEDYEADSFLRLLQPLGFVSGREDSAMPWLLPPGKAEELVADLLGSLKDAPFVAIFPGASIPERRWGSDRFRAVAELLSSLGVKSVVVGGREDSTQGNDIVGGCGGVNLAGRTSLSGTAAIIRRSCLLLSGDSGVLHIGAGLGVPTVSLFGPGRAKKWAPRGERHIIINKGLPCSPCTVFGTTPPCPINAKCLQDIAVDEVFNAVTMLLTGTGALNTRCCKRDWIEVSA